MTCGLGTGACAMSSSEAMRASSERILAALLGGGTAYGVGILVVPVLVRLAVGVALSGRGRASSWPGQIAIGLVVLLLWATPPTGILAAFKKMAAASWLSPLAIAASAVLGLVIGIVTDEYVYRGLEAQRSIYAPFRGPIVPALGILGAFVGTFWRRRPQGEASRRRHAPSGTR